MKKKSMILAVASLGSMAIIGTGFAGWVISADAKAEASGVMVAYEVKDQRFAVESGTWKTTFGGDGANKDNGKIVFGKPTSRDASITDPWFDYQGSDMQDELLTNTYSFTVASKTDGDTGTFTVSKESFEVTDTSKWTTVTTDKNYIAGQPTIKFGDDDEGVYTLTGTTAVKVEVTVTFAWGTEFGETNPFNYFNSQKVSDGNNGQVTATKANVTDELVKKANDSLTALFAANELGFTIKLNIHRN